MQTSAKLKGGVVIYNHFVVTRGSSCLVSTPKRVTFGFSASELVETPLVSVLGDGTINPHQLVETCRLGMLIGVC